MARVILPMGFATRHEAEEFTRRLNYAAPSTHATTDGVIENWWHVHVDHEEMVKATLFYEGYLAHQLFDFDTIGAE